MATDPTSQILAIAPTYGLDANLALAVAEQESGLNQSARGAAGEIGLFQVMPATGLGLGFTDLTDQTQNIEAGCMYLAQLLAEYGGDVEKALAAYNWGPGNVSNAIAAEGDMTISASPGAPAIPGWLAAAPASTRSYVAAIMANAGIVPGGSVAPGSVSASAAPTAAPGVATVPGNAPASVLTVSTAGAGAPGGMSLGTLAILFGLGVAIFMLTSDG